MNEKLQQAISAARNGQETEAQLLLTEVLKENPDETQAWFLLSTLVDSEQKKSAYLGKVLALEPDHQMAQRMLARLHAPAEVETVIEVEQVEAEEKIDFEVEEEAAASTPVAVSYDTSDFLAQEKGDTLPEWLIDEDGLEVAVSERSELTLDDGDEAVAAAAQTDLEIPDWLQEEVTPDWSETPPPPEPAAVVEKLPEKKTSTKPAPQPRPAEGQDRKKQQRFLTGILYALIVATAVIFVIAIYLAWSIFF